MPSTYDYNLSSNKGKITESSVIVSYSASSTLHPEYIM